MELGAAALEFLTGTWELHLTPSEAASVADNVSVGMGAIEFVIHTVDVGFSVLEWSL